MSQPPAFPPVVGASRTGILLVFLFALIATLALSHGAKREPVYEGKKLSHWIEATSHSDFEVQKKATRILNGIGPEAVPTLARLLKVRDSALSWRMGEWGFSTRERMDAEQMRLTAAYALGVLGKEAGAASGALVEALADESPEVHKRAARALGKIGPAALPALEAGLRDPRDPVRVGALAAIGEIGPPAKGMAPGMRVMLFDRNNAIRVGALEALGRLGPRADALSTAVGAMLNDSDPDLRETALRSLRRMEATTWEGVTNCLVDPKAEVRQQALLSLGHLRYQNAEGIGRLLEVAVGRNFGDALVARKILTGLNWSNPPLSEMTGVIEILKTHSVAEGVP